jgi:hypothetical protein
MKMTPTQQTKIAELLVSKLNAAQNKPFVEIIPQSEIQAEIQSKMVLAGVVYELVRDAYVNAWLSAYKLGSKDKIEFSATLKNIMANEDFDNFLNNMK